jgi:hypothetical protein
LQSVDGRRELYSGGGGRLKVEVGDAVQCRVPVQTFWL